MAFTNFLKPVTDGSGAVKKAKPVMMVLGRNFTVRSTLGHMLTFKKDVPMTVPPIMVRTCAEIGAERVDGDDAFKEAEQVAPTQPVDPGQRLEDVRKAVDKIAEINDVNDFTAGGSPTVGAVSRETGFKVDRNEVKIAWQQRSEDLANDEG